MKVAVVGCGNIAQLHINFIKAVKTTEIVALVDKDELALQSFSNRHGIQNTFTVFKKMLEVTNPDVVHILTPPSTHEELAMKAISFKKHVYVEKPFALNFQGAKKSYRLAKEHGVKLCPGYNHLFDPCMLKAEGKVNDLDHFGKVIFIESFYGMNVNRNDLRRTDKNGNLHWSYDLPGGLFHNYLDHPLYVLLKYTGSPLEINAFTRCFKSLPQNLADELYVFVEGTHANGFLTLSFGMRPLQHFVKIYGEKQAVKINFDTMTTSLYQDRDLPKALSKATKNLSEALSLTTSTFSNAINLICGWLNPYQGMQNLISEFYNSIEKNLPPPVPENLVLDVTKTSDEIWPQMDNLHIKASPILAREIANKTKGKVLVTGASGFVGRHLVRKLVEEGYYVRAFVRKLSFIEELERLGVEIHFGDVRNTQAFREALKGIDYVVHLAAGTKGDPGDFYDITVTGTKNLVQLAAENHIERVIYISSMSVYEVNSVRPGSVLNETHELEREMKARGTYSWSKGEAEKLLLNAMKKNTNIVWKILRPAMIIGKGSDPFLPPLGLSLPGSINLIFGSRREKLRLVYVDDVVNAIQLLLQDKNTENKIYNVSAPEMISKQDYINSIIKKIHPKSKTLYVPHLITKTGIGLIGILTKSLGKDPFLTIYRYNASQRNVRFDAALISKDLGWRPKKAIKERLLETFVKRTTAIR